MLPIVLVVFLIIAVWLVYSLQAAQKSDADYSSYYSIDANASIGDCLAKSHEITAEGLLAREAAMQSFVQSVNDWLIRNGVRLVNCFK